MRYSAAEKADMIHLIEQSNLPIRQTLKRLDITKSTFYNWLQRFDEDGLDGLHDRKSKPGTDGAQSPAYVSLEHNTFTI